jgi:hypothetical protein
MSDILKQYELEKELKTKDESIKALNTENESVRRTLALYQGRFGDINNMDHKSYDITISLEEYRWLVRENVRLQIENERLNFIERR